MGICKGGAPIDNLEQWKDVAPPKNPEKQWVDERSAMELARAWLEKAPAAMPPEVVAVLRSHPDFSAIRSWIAEPEALQRFDDFPGEPRNTDLAVKVDDEAGAYLLSVEGKADEPFGETIERTLDAARTRLAANPRSNGVRRITQLLEAIVGSPDCERYGNLRYQLLTATAGALCEAERKGCRRAVVLIHEFLTRKTDDQKHDSNAADLDRFVADLSGGHVNRVVPGQLFGPFFVPGYPLTSTRIALYLAKVVRNIR